MDGSYDQEQVVKELVVMGYQCRDQVEGICQFARRGGILDIFPPDRSEPVRIEFWDDEIDTMSTFQVDTQRHQDSIEQVTIPPARGCFTKVRKSLPICCVSRWQPEG